MNRQAQAHWEGNGAEGKGAISTQSGVFNKQPYSFHARFVAEDGKAGTNPEELIAAAHAACFTMAAAFGFAQEGLTPETLDTKAQVQMEKQEGGWAISGITLQFKAVVPGADAEKIKQVANKAKENCPISKALAAVDISLEIVGEE